MSSSYYVNGEALVSVKGSPKSITSITPLGLSTSPIKIVPHYRHYDIKVDDFGPDIPPEVLWNLTDATINMTLVYFDPAILSTCIAESAAGGTEGTMISASTPMGGGKPLYDPANHYISLYISVNGGQQQQLGVIAKPWKFPSTYLYQTPFTWPVGTEKSMVELNWRAIPYVAQGGTTVQGTMGTKTTTLNDILSAGSVVWTRSAT